MSEFYSTSGTIMIHSLELKIVQDGIAVRKLSNVFLAEISIFFFFLVLFWKLSVYNVGHPNAQSAITAMNHVCSYMCACMYMLLRWVDNLNEWIINYMGFFILKNATAYIVSKAY